ncbi:serine/threonine-protein kinase [Streptomyces kanasensis]|uniref:serine/threonine-protein kinase n=1 Tax=Streptomyces kanasensis TaxID=936756 RepID=UPI0037FBCB79
MSQEAYGARLVGGRYRLADPLREDGAGVVWRARDEVRGHDVAVREVRLPRGAGDAGGGRAAEGVERDAREAARVAHPNAVAVFDVVVEDGRPWLVTELVRGLTLAETLEAEGPLPPHRAARVGAEVLEALRAAHAAGVPHGAVAPGAVLLGNDGRVALTDFGTAPAAGPGGGPGYRAPECGPGGTATPAGDLWSLGALLYAAVEGRPPAGGDATGAAGGSGAQGAGGADGPLPSRGAGGLAPVVGALLRRDPAARPSAEEAARLLDAAGAGGAARTVRASGHRPGRHGEEGAGRARRPDGDDPAGGAGPDAGRGPGPELTGGPAGGGGGAEVPGRRASVAVSAVGLVVVVVGLVVAGLVYVALR